jgi:hypothetical protein
MPLQPTVFAFPLGRGYPISDGGAIATGTTTFASSMGLTPTAGVSVGSDQAAGKVGVHYGHVGVTRAAFDGLIPTNAIPTTIPPTTNLYAHAYSATFNGKIQTAAWSESAASPPNSVTFFKMMRADRGTGALLNTARGADYSLIKATPITQFITAGTYTQYMAWAVHVVFDSSCKRDLFINRAGSSELTALFPLDDTKGLGALLVDAKATIRVHAIALGQAAAVQAALDTTTCTTQNLAACQTLITKLTTLTKSVGQAPLPSTFAAKQTGMNDWFVDTVYLASKSSL